MKAFTYNDGLTIMVYHKDMENKTPEQITARIREVVQTVQKWMEIEHASYYDTCGKQELSLKFAKRFAKIYQDSGRCIYAFIDLANGDIYRPASYKAPAKIVRGNIFDEDQKLLSVFGPYGVAYISGKGPHIEWTKVKVQ